MSPWLGAPEATIYTLLIRWIYHHIHITDKVDISPPRNNIIQTSPIAININNYLQSFNHDCRSLFILMAIGHVWIILLLGGDISTLSGNLLCRLGLLRGL